MPEQKKVWKFWFPWNTEKIERWLEDKAARGWNLTHTDWGLRRFFFTRCEPRQVAFCLDRLSDHPDAPLSQGSEYIKLMKKDLWQLINRQASWCLWVKPYRGPKRVRFDLRLDLSESRTVRTKRQFPILPSVRRLGMPHKS